MALRIIRPQRELLVEDRTYYVRTDGNDSHSGLSNTAAGAFFTIQKAVDVVAALDMGTRQVTIQVGPGTYTEAVTLKPCLGVNPPILQGDTATPANVTITYASGTAVIGAVGAGNQWSVKGFKVIGTGTCKYGVWAHQNALLSVHQMEFGACQGAHVAASMAGIIELLANYTISGAAPSHISNVHGGIVRADALTVTLTGTPAFSAGFINLATGAFAQCLGNTYTGAATGARYSVASNAICSCGGNVNYFPGNAAGTTATGGQYI